MMLLRETFCRRNPVSYNGGNIHRKSDIESLGSDEDQKSEAVQTFFSMKLTEVLEARAFQVVDYSLVDTSISTI